jgi:hypothetical protein
MGSQYISIFIFCQVWFASILLWFFLIYIQKGYWCCSVFVMCLCSFGMNELESICFYVMKLLVKDMHDLFKYLMEFTSEATQSWTFLCAEILKY